MKAQRKVIAAMVGMFVDFHPEVFTPGSKGAMLECSAMRCPNQPRWMRMDTKRRWRAFCEACRERFEDQSWD